MPVADYPAVFGAAARCCSFAELRALFRQGSHGCVERRQMAAAGMALAAAEAVVPDGYFEETRRVVDAMARAKAELDIDGWHTPHVVETTAWILAAAQRFFDDTTVPCTEWATPSQVAAEALHEALRRAL